MSVKWLDFPGNTLSNGYFANKIPNSKYLKYLMYELSSNYLGIIEITKYKLYLHNLCFIYIRKYHIDKSYK